MPRSADDLEAAGHDKLAEGHALLAKARRARAVAPSTSSEWVSPAESPLGKRTTLALCRAGALESSKIGRKVLVRRSSLESYLARHERGVELSAGEDLFGTGAT